MSIVDTLAVRLRLAILPALCICALGYFGYHLVQGRHGLGAYAVYGEQIRVLKAEEARLAATRAKLQNQVNLLHPRSLDPDYLDELARRELNYVAPDDIVVPLDQKPR